MIEKILERLEEYKYTNLVERDKESLEHCTENDRAEHCEGTDCFWCVWDKATSIVQEVAKEYEDKANEAREDFMEIVYSELEEDADNNRANRIIDAFDTYAPYQKGE